MSTIAQGGIHAVPQDIIDSIIDEIANLRRNESDKQDLWNCSLVSPAFRSRSQSWLLRTLKIEIYPAYLNPIREAINVWIHQTLETNPRIASYVRSMSISILVDDYVEDSRPVGTAGFSGSPLILPNLRELEIIAHTTNNTPFSDFSVELETELINLMQSPQVHRISLSGIVPPTDLAALYKLNYLEVRDADYDEEITVHPSLQDLHHSQVGYSLSENGERLRSLLWLYHDWELESILFSKACGLKHLEDYAIYLTQPENLKIAQQVLLSASESLRSFSITVGEPFVSHAEFDLGALSNLVALEFIVDDKHASGIAFLFQSVASVIWPFIRKSITTLRPFNKLATIKLRFSGEGFYAGEDEDELSQFDDLLSDMTRFDMLQQVFVSSIGRNPPYSLPKTYNRGIVINGHDKCLWASHSLGP